MMMKVGAAPISWGACEVPGWGALLPWELVLDQMRDAGYEGTELGPPGYLPVDASLLSTALERRQLAMASAFVALRFSEPAHIEEDLRLAESTGALLSALGATTMIVADAGNEDRLMLAGDVGSSGGLSDAQWIAMAATLKHVAAVARKQGLRLAFHSHAGTYVETREELDRLCAMTNPEDVGLCLDTGHLAFGGADPVDVAHAYASRITYLHLKDVNKQALQRVRAEHAGFREAVTQQVFTIIGEGDVDFDAVRGSLHDAGYAGWLIVEQDARLPRAEGAPEELRIRAQRNRDAVRRMFGV